MVHPRPDRSTSGTTIAHSRPWRLASSVGSMACSPWTLVRFEEAFCTLTAQRRRVVPRIAEREVLRQYINTAGVRHKSALNPNEENAARNPNKIACIRRHNRCCSRAGSMMIARALARAWVAADRR